MKGNTTVALELLITGQTAFPLGNNDLTLGSDAQCDVIVRQAEPRHAKMKYVAGRWFLEAIGSSAVWINDRELSKAFLKVGDEFRFSPNGVLLQLAEVVDSADPSSSSPRIGDEAASVEVYEFIESFRQLLAVPDPAHEAKLAEMLATYSGLCEDANRRLRQCDSLSQKGLYANAVSASEREPNLLDRSTALEIPERDILATVASALGVAPPTLLNRDLVEALQETYQKGMTSEGNIKLLHRLTLARAPLPTRLAIMRRLQIQDPNRVFIDVDIRSFERAWFKRAMDFAQPFAKAGNVGVLEEIIYDLRESGYVETPPAQLLTALQSLLSKAHSLQLPELAKEIQQAYQLKNVTLLKSLKDRWSHLISATGRTDAAQAYDVKEALEWLNGVLTDGARKAEISKAQARLHSLLENRKSTRADVEAAYNAVQILGDIDRRLHYRCQNWLQQESRQKSIRKISIAAAGVVLMATCGIGYFLRANFLATEQQQSAAINSLVQLVEEGKFAEALEAGRKAPAAIASHPTVVKHLSKATAGLEKSVKFKEAIAKLATTNSKSEFKVLEAQAQANAVAPSQRSELDEAVKRFNLRNSRQSGDFKTRVAELEINLDQLLSSIRQKGGIFVPALEQPTNDCRKAIAALQEDLQTFGMSESDFSNVLSKFEKVVPYQKAAARQSRFLAEMEQAKADDAALKKTADFLSKSLALDHPDETIKSRAKAAETDLVVWQQAHQLTGLIETGTIDLKTQEYWKNKPPSEAVKSALSQSETTQQRDFSREGSAAYALKMRLTALDIVDVYCIRMELAEPYCFWYTKEMPEAGSDPIDCRVITEPNGSIIQKVRGTRRPPVLSPQSALLPKLQTLWTEKSSPDDWHERLAAAYGLLADNDDIEPLLKVQLTRQFMTLAVRTSVGYSQLLEPLPGFQSIIGPAGIVEGNWYNPKNALTPERAKATKICEAAPRLSKYAANAAKIDRAQATAQGPRVQLVGLLTVGQDGQAKLSPFTHADPAGDCQLYVVSEQKWQNVGSTLPDRTVQLKADAVQFLSWPVFSISATKAAQ